jgi:hypothetical protein
MIKHFFLLPILVFIATLSVFGQARIGSTEQSIRNDFSDRTFKSGYDSDGDKWISAENSFSSIIYYFNSNKVCYLTAVIPDTEAALNYLVEEYNKTYVIISETKWKMYSANGIMEIELKFSDGGGYYFIMY